MSTTQEKTKEAPKHAAASPPAKTEEKPKAAAVKPNPNPRTYEVRATSAMFSPNMLEVKIGDSVKWINDDSEPRTVTFDAADGAPAPSGDIAPGKDHTSVFSKAGEFHYHDDHSKDRSSGPIPTGTVKVC